MKILLVHNRYVNRGGEDSVFDRERVLLAAHGHQVVSYTKDNREIGATGGGNMLRLALNTVWSSDSYDEVSRLIAESRPDVMHVHNTLPRISPAVYHAAVRQGVAVVQTLHNYRLHCVNGLLMREGRLCEDCVGKTIPFPAVRHACYRGSRAASATVAAALSVHRVIGTFSGKVARYIALSNFSRNKLLSAGLPPDRVVVKPNFAEDVHGPYADDPSRRGGLFVGRLSEEKGVGVLTEAWRQLQVPVSVTSDGPLAEPLRAASPGFVHMLGYVTDAQVAAAMRAAAFLVVPSIVYEGFPMVVAEAYAAGLPVIASRLGALGELVEDGVTGLHFTAGDPADLAAKVRWASQHPREMAAMGRRARSLYERNYTPGRNYVRLMEIYEEARQTLASQAKEGVPQTKWSST